MKEHVERRRWLGSGEESKVKSDALVLNVLDATLKALGMNFIAGGPGSGHQHIVSS